MTFVTPAPTRKRLRLWKETTFISIPPWLLHIHSSCSGLTSASSHTECKRPPGWGRCAGGACTSCARTPPPSEWPSSALDPWYPCHLWDLAEECHLGNVSAPPGNHKQKQSSAFIFKTFEIIINHHHSTHSIRRSVEMVQQKKITRSNNLSRSALKKQHRCVLIFCSVVCEAVCKQ